MCGAAVIAHNRCLAHLTPRQLTAYLATLGPGSDINARGVRFSRDLLTKLLRPFRSGLNASVGSADFSEATFTDNVLLFRISFAKHANFNNATFTEGAQFTRVSFHEDTDFKNATFGKGARFSRVVFRRADFMFVKFMGPAVFLCKAQELILTRAHVSGELAVESAAGAVTAANLRGGGRLSLRLRAARVDLSGLVFNGPVDLHALQQPLDWDESSLADPVTGVPPVRLVSLAGADAGRLVLSDLDLTECRFAGMHRMDQLFFDGRCVFARDPRGVRQVLAEEGYWRAARRWRRWKRPGARRWVPAPDGVEIVGPARLQVMYRQLRKAVEDVRNEPGATDFYYGEMEMRRHTDASRAGDRLIIWLYWLLSGYGLRVLRSLGALIILGAIVTAALTGWGLAAADLVAAPPQRIVGTVMTIPHKPAQLNATLREIAPGLPPDSQRWTRERTGTALEVTLESLIFRSTDQPLTTVGIWTTIAARIFGPVLLALSLLAIRSRVKR